MTDRVSVDGARLRAWAYLSRVAEAPCAELSTLVNQAGPEEAAQRIPSRRRRTQASRAEPRGGAIWTVPLRISSCCTVGAGG